MKKWIIFWKLLTLLTILISYWKELLKQLKREQKNKARIFSFKTLIQSSCNTFQLLRTLCKERPRPTHLIRHNVLNPGNLVVKSSLNFLNKLSRFGETFYSFEISEVVWRRSLRFLTSNNQLQRMLITKMPVAVAKNKSQLFGFDLSYQWESPSPLTTNIFSVKCRGHAISF